MTDYNNEKLNPEDFWPEASEMLDSHFQAKKRRRILIFFSFFLAMLLGTFYFLNRSHPAPRATAAATAGTTSLPQNAVAGNGEKSLPENEPKAAANANKLVDKTTPVNKASSRGSVQTPPPAVTTNRAVAPVSAMTSSSVSSSSLPVPLSSATSAIPPVIMAMPEETAIQAALEATEESMAYMTLLSGLAALPDSVKGNGVAPGNAAWLKKSSTWELLVYAGGGIVGKTLGETPNALYLDRRTKEENPAYMPYAGLQLAKSIKNWDLRAGLEFSVVGEQVNYSPYARGQYFNTYQDWEPYSYTVSDTDSTYIFGVLFLNTRLETVNDSIYVTKTDTLNGLHYDPTIQTANGINRWYVVEMPLEVAYSVGLGRWGVGLSAGLAPGVVVQSSGRYLREDESGLTRIEKEQSGQFTLNARAGLEFSYLLNSHLRVMVRPSGRYFITKVNDGTSGQRYHQVGINAGLLFTIH